MPTLSESRDSRIIERKLFCRQQLQRRDVFERSLCIGIKCPERIDLIVKQINAHRRICAHGKNIHQSAAHGILTALHNHIRGVVASGIQQEALFLDAKTLATV